MNFLRVNFHWYIYPLLAILFVGLGAVLTKGAMFSIIGQKLTDGEWWAENTISLFIFTLFGGGLVWAIQEFREREARRPFEGWELETRGLNHSTKERIYWEDARKFDVSPFEEWKFIKSAVSNACQIKTRCREKAFGIWYWFEPKESTTPGPRTYIIDFSKMEPDRDISKWNLDEAPKGFELADAESGASQMPKRIEAAANKSPAR